MSTTLTSEITAQKLWPFPQSTGFGFDVVHTQSVAFKNYINFMQCLFLYSGSRKLCLTNGDIKFHHLSMPNLCTYNFVWTKLNQSLHYMISAPLQHGQSCIHVLFPQGQLEQGLIQEFKKGGSFKRVRAEHAEKFGWPHPFFPNHTHFN